MPLRDTPSIAVICGGSSREAEVSRVSGKAVAEALSTSFKRVMLVELDAAIAETLRQARVDVVYPVLHGAPGEDGTLQGLLEILGLPYVGSGVLASACAMDKIVAKDLFKGHGLPVAPDAVVGRAEGASAAAERVGRLLGADVVLKPHNSGSGLGVLFSKDFPDLGQALERGFAENERLLVEKRVAGREITCGILERDGVEALPVLEIVTPKGSWYDYEHRYTAGLSRHVVPAPLPQAQYRRVQEVAISAFQALGCRDLARVDFVVPERGEPILLEVNTLPGMTPTSLYPDEAKAHGLSFEALVAHFAERAHKRSPRLSRAGG